MARFSAVPWLDDTDLAPMGAPETTVEIGDEIAHGLRVVEPWGVGTDTIISIHAHRITGRITLCERLVEINVEPSQSNVRRRADP